MANKTLFKSNRAGWSPKADTFNEAGGLAYSMSSTHALAQYAATGCLNSTFYASNEVQLEEVLKLCMFVEPEFIAKTALYSREKACMKDTPALLCAVLSNISPDLLKVVFNRVINSPKMLRNFVQIMRSGVVGRQSLGSLPKRLILQWLDSRTDEQLFYASIGNDPSLADIIKMVHPKPKTESRSALYGYLLKRDYNKNHLPDLVRQYEKFKVTFRNKNVFVPDVPFQFLTSMDLSPKTWKKIARNASWQMTRMNLNTFHRHDVFLKTTVGFQDNSMIEMIASRLRNPELIRKAKAFPYQLMVAYQNANREIPFQVRDALQDAMEIATENIPEIPGKVFVFPDVSGSMQSPVTGYREGSTTAVRCVDVAALISAAILRKNPGAEVIPFESNIVKKHLNPRDSVMTNAKILSSIPYGGTNCSAPLKELNDRKASGDLLIYVSDNESWIDTRSRRWGNDSTETMKQWEIFKRRNRNAKLVCIDIQPNSTMQAPERNDIINVGGFSDQVFKMIADVAHGDSSIEYWVKAIEAIPLD